MAAVAGVKVADCPIQIVGELIAMDPIAETLMLAVVDAVHVPFAPVTV